MINPEIPKGFKDYLPKEMIARQHLISIIQRVFERYGFLPLDTPSQEYALTLLGKGSPEMDKQIYRLRSPEGKDVGLRFDLTVPLARVVAQYPNLPKPFRRYQIGHVFRAEKPDPGRFREFIQADIDIVGSSLIASDAEIICIMYDTLKALGISRFKIRINNRKVLNSLADFVKIPEDKKIAVFRVIDKLEKQGIDAIKEELTNGRIDESGDKIAGLGLSLNKVERIIEFLSQERGNKRELISSLKAFFSDFPQALLGINELEELCGYLEAMEISEESVVIDISIARGLDYYTGTVFEAILQDAQEFGAVFAGGRYDELIKRFSGVELPGTGASLGVSRILDALVKLNILKTPTSTTQVLVTVMEEDKISQYKKIARELRLSGVNTELYLGNKGLSFQLQYANAQEIPIAIIIGSDEFLNDCVCVKDLRKQLRERSLVSGHKEWVEAGKKAQITISRKDLVETVKKML
ncbi:MAG: histidine--tRNA ligase [bacterium]